MNTQDTNRPPTLNDAQEQFEQWLLFCKPDQLHRIDIRRVSRLFDTLADCDDVLPEELCEQLQISEGSTYSQAIAKVRRLCAEQQKDEPNETKRSAEDVYLEYAEKVGEEACDDAVLDFFDPSGVVQILLDTVDADELEEFLYENLVAEWPLWSWERDERESW